VFFYPVLGRSCCAVLLKTSFFLANDQLQYALLPLAFGPPVPNTSDPPGDTIDILEYFPSEEECVRVMGQQVEEQSSSMPNVAFPTPGGQVQISGLGRSKKSAGLSVCMIYLTPTRMPKMAAHLPSMKWEFKDKHGIYFPSTTKILVVIEKQTTDPTFAFDMHLTQDVLVDIHTGWFARRLKPRNERPKQGWSFKIKGNYKSSAAKQALEDAKEAEAKNVPHVPKFYGIRAAAVDYVGGLR